MCTSGGGGGGVGGGGSRSTFQFLMLSPNLLRSKTHSKTCSGFLGVLKENVSYFVFSAIGSGKKIQSEKFQSNSVTFLL